MSESAPSSSREMRNRAEKQRRDKLNAYISELYSLVPSAAAAPRKLDKTSTLRLSANFLRLHQNVDLRGKPYNRWSAMAGHVILEKLDSFLLAVSCCSGKVIYVSDRVEKLLGHAQVDMMGYQLSCFVHPSDLETFEKKLSTFAAQVTSNPDSVETHKGQVYSFECRLAGRQLSRGEPTVYERVSISGTFRGPRRRRDWADNFVKRNSSNDFSEPLFIGIVKLLQTPNTLPPLTMMQAVQDEYYTQHTTTGTIIRTDHRIATIAGYFSGEVTGMSAHDYIFSEDLEYTLKAQSLMLSRSEGVVTYRLKTSTGRLIFLRSRGFIQYDENTKEITSFFCINSHIDEKEGLKEIQEMRAMLDKLNINASTSATPLPLNSNQSYPSLPAALQRRPVTSNPEFNGQCDEAVTATVSPQAVVKEFAPIPHESHSLTSIENVHSPCESTVSSLHSEDCCLASTGFPRGSPCLEISNGVELNRSQIPFPWSPAEFSSKNVNDRSGNASSKVREIVEPLSIIGTNVRQPHQFVETIISLPSSSNFTIISNNHQNDVGHKRFTRTKDMLTNGKPFAIEDSVLRKAETNHFEQPFHNGGLKQDAETNSA